MRNAVCELLSINAELRRAGFFEIVKTHPFFPETLTCLLKFGGQGPATCPEFPSGKTLLKLGSGSPPLWEKNQRVLKTPFEIAKNFFSELKTDPVLGIIPPPQPFGVKKPPPKKGGAPFLKKGNFFFFEEKKKKFFCGGGKKKTPPQFFSEKKKWANTKYFFFRGGGGAFLFFKKNIFFS